MSFQVEHLIYDLTQYLVLIPGGLAPPPPQGDVITTQVSRFVGETPPPSFAQFPRHPAPPSGHDVVQALGYWSFALGGIRYYVPKFDTPEPRVEPEVWSISVTRAPDSVDGPPATRPTAPVLATAASSSTLAAAAAAASSSTTTLAGAQPQLQQQQQGQRRRGSVLRWAESVGAADPVTPSRGGGAGQRESSPGVSRLAGMSLGEAPQPQTPVAGPSRLDRVPPSSSTMAYLDDPPERSKSRFRLDLSPKSRLKDRFNSAAHAIKSMNFRLIAERKARREAEAEEAAAAAAAEAAAATAAQPAAPQWTSSMAAAIRGGDAKAQAALRFVRGSPQPEEPPLLPMVAGMGDFTESDLAREQRERDDRAFAQETELARSLAAAQRSDEDDAMREDPPAMLGGSSGGGGDVTMQAPSASQGGQGPVSPTLQGGPSRRQSLAASSLRPSAPLLGASAPQLGGGVTSGGYPSLFTFSQPRPQQPSHVQQWQQSSRQQRDPSAEASSATPRRGTSPISTRRGSPKGFGGAGPPRSSRRHSSSSSSLSDDAAPRFTASQKDQGRQIRPQPSRSSPSAAAARSSSAAAAAAASPGARATPSSPSAAAAARAHARARAPTLGRAASPTSSVNDPLSAFLAASRSQTPSSASHLPPPRPPTSPVLPTVALPPAPGPALAPAPAPALAPAPAPAPLPVQYAQEALGEEVHELLAKLFETKDPDALALVPYDGQHTHLEPEVTQSAEDTLDERLESKQGQMFFAALAAAAFLVTLNLAFRAAKNRKTAVELEAFARALLPWEHALLYFCMVESMAPFYLRTGAEAKDLLERCPWLDSRNCNSPGTYLIVVDGDDGLRMYVGSAYGQTIAERQKDHVRKLEAIKAARGKKDIIAVELETEEMELLYRPGVKEHYHFVLTRGPEDMSEQEMAEWLRARFPEVVCGRGLDMFGSVRCKKPKDRWQYEIRLVTAFAEHVGCAMIGTVSGDYRNAYLFEDGMFRDRPSFRGANRSVPSVGFGGLKGTKSWRIAKAAGKLKPKTKAERKKELEEFAEHPHLPPLSSSLDIGAAELEAEEAAAAAAAAAASSSDEEILSEVSEESNEEDEDDNDVQQQQSTGWGTRAGAMAASMGGPAGVAVAAATQAAAAAAAGGSPVASSSAAPAAGGPPAWTSAAAPAPAAAGSLAGYSMATSLNIFWDQCIKTVTYVDVLPPLQEDEVYDCKGTELARYEDRTVYRLASVAKAQREAAWDLLDGNVGAPCEVVGQGTEVDITLFGLNFSLPMLQPLNLPDGPAHLILEPRAGVALQPQSCSGEASYILRDWIIRFRSDVTGQEDDWRPRAEVVEAGWEDFLRPLAQMWSIEGQQAAAAVAAQAGGSDEPNRVAFAKVPRTPNERILHGIGVRIFEDGCRLEIEDGSNGKSLLAVPGTTWMHSKYGTFTTAASDATKVVELDIAPAGHPQDIILKLNSNRTKILFAKRPRYGQSSSRPVGIGEWRSLWPTTGEPVADEWLECYFLNLELMAKGCAAKHFIKPGEPRGSKRAHKTRGGRRVVRPRGSP